MAARRPRVGDHGRLPVDVEPPVERGVAVVEFNAAGFVDPYRSRTVREVISANKTLDAEDTGKLFCVTADGDGDALTLPAIADGLNGITILAVGAFGTTAVTISPNASDMILGPDITRDFVNHDIAVETTFDGPSIDLMAAALREEDPQGVAVPYMLSGGTDAKAFSTLGIRCYGFAPLKLPPAPACPQCGAPMQQRTGKSGAFWSCSRYPDCKGTLPIESPTGRRSAPRKRRAASKAS